MNKRCGMKSIEDDLLEYLLMSLRTSTGVTEGNVSTVVTVNIGRMKEG